MARKFKVGDVVRNVSVGHPRNVPVGSVGIVVSFETLTQGYKVRWYAYPDADDMDVTQKTDLYFGRELRKVESEDARI